MEPFTIFLDTNDPRRAKSFWIFHLVMCVFWIFQGIKNESGWYGWVLIIGGTVAIVMAIGNFVIQKKYGRRKLTFHDSELEIKVKQLGESEKIPWQEIEHITMQTNSAEVIKKTEPDTPVKIPFESYVVTQQAKKLFHDYATKNNIAIV